MNKAVILLIFLVTLNIYAQNGTSTPYSLFALGVENKTATGGLTGLGNSGIALPSANEINIFNPANLGNIWQKTFLYEFGINASYSTFKTQSETQTTNDANISHVAIAFPIMKNIGISAGLLPYTKVGYNIDVINTVEGSTSSYITRINGSGGLNKFYIATGVQLGKKLSLGLDMSFLFGSVNQETLIGYQTLTAITDENHYTGTKFKTGLQYTFPKIKNTEVTFGAIVGFSAKLKGSQLRNSYKTTAGGARITLQEDVENELNDFEFPLETGLGLSANIDKSITANIDYKRLLWNDTNQYQNSDRYSNQSIYAFGIEYFPGKKRTSVVGENFWNKLKYRLGANYNTGFLTISNTKIDSYFVAGGISVPLSKINSNWLNISYSYGKEGTVANSLIQENFHKLTINLNFIGSWFRERKIN